MDPYWLTVVVSAVLPILVALITKRVAAGWVKSLVLLALAAVTGTLTQLQTSGSFDWKQAVAATVVSFVVAVASHYGLLKEVSLTGSDGRIQTRIPGGIG